ncbi:hypothetical protein RvY_00520-1 [Ramazzottius varieornatus]|uniref:EGF-like domain-containing protein n=1 Tax=Ramazzottius varieornatus TaxID=947166 RepID=A0A1D1UD23_RAMVA|nr:hypothetical protein RvY_00520-1 [Ramazzottius varieornatus]
MDGFKCTKNVGMCQRQIDKPLREKYKDDETFWDFSCAMTAFCPDPCCGAYKNPMDDPVDIGNCKRKNIDFPCHHAGQNDDCQFEGKKNRNFFDLIQNRVNITCGCNAKEGKVWDSHYSTCMDVDECVESNPCKADTEVCINRLNGKAPLCVCEFGYFRKPGSASKTCKPDPDSGLFRDIDMVEKRMKELYGPIEEGKPPQLPTEKAVHTDAMKQALNNLKLTKAVAGDS